MVVSAKPVLGAAALLLTYTLPRAGASSPPPCHDPECTKEPADSKVFQLNPDNFHRFVNKNPLTLMEFYAPWCGHCQVRACLSASGAANAGRS